MFDTVLSYLYGELPSSVKVVYISSAFSEDIYILFEELKVSSF